MKTAPTRHLHHHDDGDGDGDGDAHHVANHPMRRRHHVINAAAAADTPQVPAGGQKHRAPRRALAPQCVATTRQMPFLRSGLHSMGCHNAASHPALETPQMEKETPGKTATSGGAGAGAGALTSAAQEAQHHASKHEHEHEQQQQQQQREPRRQRHRHLRVMPPSGCPIPPCSAHPPLVSHQFTRSASLPLRRPTPPLKSPHSSAPSSDSSPPFTPSPPSSAVSAASLTSSPPFTPSPPSSAVSAASLTSSPPSSASTSAAVKASFHSSDEICCRSRGFLTSRHSPCTHHSPSITVAPRPVFVRQYSEPSFRRNQSNSPGTSPVGSPGTIPGDIPEFREGQLSSSEPQGQPRPGLSPKHSCLSRGRPCCGQRNAAGPKLVRRVSFSSIVQVRRFMDMPPPDAYRYCSDTNESCSNALNRGRRCSNTIAWSRSDQQQQQQQQHQPLTTLHDSYSTPSGCFNIHPPASGRSFSSSLQPSSASPPSPSLSPSPSVDFPHHLKPHPPPPRNLFRSSLTSSSSSSSCSAPPPHAHAGMLPSPAARRLIARLRATAPARQASEGIVGGA